MFSRIAKRVVLAGCGVLAAVSLALTGCGGTQIAATVNGEEIPESAVTEYVENFINANGFSTDEWAQYLGLQETTAAEFRQEGVDYYVNYLLYRQKAAELGISITEEEIDTAIATMKEEMDSDGIGWENYLKSYGYTEESYRPTCEYSLLVSKLQDTQVEQKEATDEQRREFADACLLQYDAKHVLGIKFGTSQEDYEEAEALLKEILAADDPKAAFKANISKSKDEDFAKADGEMGWSCLVTYGDDWSELVANDLEEGKVYGYLYKTDDAYYLLYCDGGYAPVYYGDIDVALEHMPKAIKEVFESDLARKMFSDAAEEYTNSLREAADVVVNDMPSGLPYDVEPVKESDE